MRVHKTTQLLPERIRREDRQTTQMVTVQFDKDAVTTDEAQQLVDRGTTIVVDTYGRLHYQSLSAELIAVGIGGNWVLAEIVPYLRFEPYLKQYPALSEGITKSICYPDTFALLNYHSKTAMNYRDSNGKKW